MKKIISLALCILLVFMMFSGCKKIKTEPPVEEVTPPVAEDNKKSDSEPEVTPDPEPEETEEEIFQKLRMSEEGKAFYNAEKGEWGENDFKIYDYKGEVLRKYKTADEESEGGMRGVRLEENELTYRGIAIGDDAFESLLRMNIPKEAVFPWGEDIYEYGVPYDINKLSSYSDRSGTTYINICFDKNFQVLDVLDVYPYTYNIGVVWEVTIVIKDEKILNYYASGLSYFIKDETNS